MGGPRAGGRYCGSVTHIQKVSHDLDLRLIVLQLVSSLLQGWRNVDVGGLGRAGRGSHDSHVIVM